MTSLGPWDPLPVESVVQLFRSAPFRWWLCGGLALEQHLGRSWRSHDDVDVGILRGDVPRLFDLLVDWDIQVAAAGALSRWNGDVPNALAHENNLWCRRSDAEPWCLDITVSDGDEQGWVHRRHPEVRVPWNDAVLTRTGVDYLAPQVQLSFKVDRPRPKDEADAAEVIPELDPVAKRWLGHFLDAEHPWQCLLR